MDVLKQADRLHPRLVALRRAFHAHPELAFEEVRTAERIMVELDRLGISYDYGGPGGGVVGTVGTGTRPTVALRAEMDALPMQETTRLPFASRRPGVMHACGHDAHMAMLLGAAELLQQDPPAGRVLLIFQPAEEIGGGARVMLQHPDVQTAQAIFALHVTSSYSVGEVAAVPGVMTAQSDVFKVLIKGKGGHGARPHEATDAIVIAGLMITAVQTLVSRETNPFHPSVITIGRIQGGSAANAIAEDVVLEGSIRTTLPEVREQVLKGLRRMARAMGDLHDAQVKVEIQEGYPPVVNTHRETDIARRAAAAVVGEQGVRELKFPSMGAEDFSYYLQAIPGCYARIGSGARDQEPVPLHSPAFDVHEGVLSVGAAYFDRVAREALTTLANHRNPGG